MAPRPISFPRSRPRCDSVGGSLLEARARAANGCRYRQPYRPTREASCGLLRVVSGQAGWRMAGGAPAVVRLEHARREAVTLLEAATQVRLIGEPALIGDPRQGLSLGQ